MTETLDPLKSIRVSRIGRRELNPLLERLSSSYEMQEVDMYEASGPVLLGDQSDRRVFYTTGAYSCKGGVALMQMGSRYYGNLFHNARSQNHEEIAKLLLPGPFMLARVSGIYGGDPIIPGIEDNNMMLYEQQLNLSYMLPARDPEEGISGFACAIVPASGQIFWAYQSRNIPEPIRDGAVSWEDLCNRYKC